MLAVFMNSILIKAQVASAIAQGKRERTPISGTIRLVAWTLLKNDNGLFLATHPNALKIPSLH